ncbi:hypothetical protein [Tunturibacter empetritectus]|uniref:Uncharacterized protein n=1 Tax=Tunturiibacter lichenicola TaxID=2051959 RepID=A0A7W8J9D6_9BACT|nr:hypothetical protein [Edaphobacter lichenicola]MBB5343896.1 hypothetical protein [Edaphobacter lichenicola]
MRTALPSVIRPFCFTLALLATSTLLLSQTPPPAVKTYDGGTRQTLESIFIPPMTNAPFSLTLETEWTRPMGANGGTYTLVNKRRIMRDRTGRIYQERWLLVPKNGKMESVMDFIQISNPADHTLYNCQIDIKRCFLIPYTGSVTTTYQPAIHPSGALADNAGYQQHEDLGHNNVAGIDTIGYREITTLNPGVFGNDQPMITTREFWYSPQLGINILSKLDTPQSGKQTFTARDLSTSEPEAHFFALPEGFTVQDQRTPAP